MNIKSSKELVDDANKMMVENPNQFDPRKYLLLSKDAMKEVVKSRLQEFGTAGNASSINSISLGEMSKKYKSGEFKVNQTFMSPFFSNN